MCETSASQPAVSTIKPLSLALAFLIMVGGSIYPFMFAGQGEGVNHGFACAIFVAMSAGLVHGVGFRPQFVLWRWLFSGWACCGALLWAFWIRWV